jgi:hypothetical protein
MRTYRDVPRPPSRGQRQARAVRPIARRIDRPDVPDPSRNVPVLARSWPRNDHLDPYLDYGRFLTPEGGVLFSYKDLDLRWRHTLWRLFAWTCASGLEGWLLLNRSPVESAWINLVCFVFIGAINWFIVKKPVEIYRLIELRLDCMILEGKDVFWVERMENGWPAFRPDKDGNRILCGIYGTRFVEYATVRRFDDQDRMPEVFISHLQEAMGQLWMRQGVDEWSAPAQPGSRRIN